MEKNNRKGKLVDKKLQYEIIGTVIASGVGICIIMVFGFKYLMNEIMNILSISQLQPEITMTLLNNVNQVFMYLVLLVVCALLLSLSFAMYLSNRIAGPIFNMDRVLDTFEEGDKEIRIQIRKKDFFDSHAQKINRLLEKAKNS